MYIYVCGCAVVMMVAAISIDPNKSTPSDQNPRTSRSSSSRPPLLPSEKDNAFIAHSKRPKSKQVPSRYMSPSPSPSSSSRVSASNSNNTRAVSVDRRRPSPARPDLNQKLTKKGNEMSSAAKLLVTSTRSLSVSFQGEAYSFPVSKTKPQSPNLESVIKGTTPERKRSNTPPVRGKVDGNGDHFENSKPIDQHRWPARIRQSDNTLSRSLNYSAEDKKKLVGSDKVIRALQQSMIAYEGRRASFDGRLSLNLGNTELLKAREKKQSLMGDEDPRVSFDGRLGPNLENAELLKAREKQQYLMGDEDQRASFDGKLSRNLGNTELLKSKQQSLMGDESRRASFDGRIDLNIGNAELMKARELGPTRCSVNESDSESVSSGSTSGVQDSFVVKPSSFSVSPRFWQETNSRLRRLHDPGSPLSNSPAKLAVPPKFGQSKRYPSDGVISSPRTMSSPIRSGVRPSSSSKLMPSLVSSPSRRMSSPSRVRNSISGLSETPSVLSYAVDVRRGKVGENQLIDAHLLRLLYNRHLQWRFVNAQAESALLVQKRSAEKKLWNAWIKISGLRDSVTKKRHRLQLLKQKLKLSSILKGQITFLEGWAFFEKDHFVSLLGAIEALKASTIRLPVVGATADVQNVEEAIDSAVNIMQALTSSLCLLSTKADEMNLLVVELVKVTAKESALLEKSKGFFSILASMQVKNCSLRTHMLQHNRVPSA